MRKYPFPLAAVLVLAMACASSAAEKPRPAQGNQTQPKKVWTNEDMDQLRARGLISVVGQEVAATPQPAPAAPSGAAGTGTPLPVHQSRLDDPGWYAEKAADLQAELDRRLADLQQQQEAIDLVKERVTQPGVAMDKPSLGVTPAESLAILQAKVKEIQGQLDELSDLARKHEIPAGLLRG